MDGCARYDTWLQWKLDGFWGHLARSVFGSLVFNDRLEVNCSVPADDEAVEALLSTISALDTGGSASEAFDILGGDRANLTQFGDALGSQLSRLSRYTGIFGEVYRAYEEIGQQGVSPAAYGAGLAGRGGASYLAAAAGAGLGGLLGLPEGGVGAVPGAGLGALAGGAASDLLGVDEAVGTWTQQKFLKAIGCLPQSQ